LSEKDVGNRAIQSRHQVEEDVSGRQIDSV